MIFVVIARAWVWLNTLGTLIIICADGGTPSSRTSDWIGIGISCVLSPLTVLFIIQPITTLITKIKRKKRKK
jgi:hypothetical protein